MYSPYQSKLYWRNLTKWFSTKLEYQGKSAVLQCFAHTLICKFTSNEVLKWGIFGSFKDENVKTIYEKHEFSPNSPTCHLTNNCVLNFLELQFFSVLTGIQRIIFWRRANTHMFFLVLPWKLRHILNPSVSP